MSFRFVFDKLPVRGCERYDAELLHLPHFWPAFPLIGTYFCRGIEEPYVYAYGQHHGS